MASVVIHLLKIYISWEEERFHPVLGESAVGLQRGKGKKDIKVHSQPLTGDSRQVLYH